MRRSGRTPSRRIMLHYPEGKFLNYSDNIIVDIDKDNTIYHRCGTDHGSSGAPIINLDTFKVIGVHQGAGNFKKENFHEEVIMNLQLENKKEKYLIIEILDK